MCLLPKERKHNKKCFFHVLLAASEQFKQRIQSFLSFGQEVLNMNESRFLFSVISLGLECNVLLGINCIDLDRKVIFSDTRFRYERMPLWSTEMCLAKEKWVFVFAVYKKDIFMRKKVGKEKQIFQDSLPVPMLLLHPPTPIFSSDLGLCIHPLLLSQQLCSESRACKRLCLMHTSAVSNPRGVQPRCPFRQWL